MLKTYKTLAHSAVINIDTKSGSRRITLENGFIDGKGRRGGVYVTDDADVQKGIESHPRFRNGFYDQIWTDDVEKKAAKPKEEPKAEEPKEESKEIPVNE